MVKMLALFVVSNVVALLEVVAVAAITCGVGLLGGLPAVFITAGVFGLLKAFELDLRRGSS